MGAKSIKFWAITLILIICLTTMTLFGFLTFINVSNSLNKQYDNESESVLKQVMFSFEYQFSNVENILQQLSQSVITKSTDGEVTSLLHNYQKILPTSGALIYGLENSKYFQGIGEKFPEGYNPVEQQWYQKAIKNKGEVVWTEPYLDNQTKEFIISASQAVTNSDGTQGVISIVFNLNEISKLISNSKIGKDGLVLLLSNNGTIIANQDTKLIGKSLFGNEHKKLLKATNKDQVPFVIDNKEYLLHSSTIQQNGMSVVTAISKDEINETLFASIMPILVAGILCFLLFGVISYLAALRGVKPLKKLGTLMGYVENGNYDVYARERDYKEVVRLAKGFNNMIYAIKKRDRDLIFTNEELKRAEEKLRGKYEELQESQRILKESEEKVARLASYDSLTGILNRRSLIKVLKNSLNQSLKAVIFIDLDNFKTVNDSLGHIFGDKLIIEVANKLSSLFVENKDVARISGDEFVLVIHDLEFEEQAELIAKEVVQLFNEPFKIDSKFLNVTASVGVALYPLHAVTSEDLLKIADMAMYRAKDMGKNGYRIFDEGIKQEVEEKVQIEMGIRECLDNNEFELFFQPLFNPVERRVTSIEALLRNHSPSLSKFNIMQIIQTAEMTGQIVDIDKWVLREACKLIKKINSHIQNPVNISINISAVHIMQQDFVDNIGGIIEASGVQSEWIELEITETSLMESFELNKEKLYELKKLGISLHLDDFGTGYSSLNYLNSLPIDRVKIDKSFVDVIVESEKDSKIVETIINLSHNLGLEVVAEGVEDKEQYKILENYRCNLIQGYFISKPLNYDQIISTIHPNNNFTLN